MPVPLLFFPALRATLRIISGVTEIGEVMVSLPDLLAEMTCG